MTIWNRAFIFLAILLWDVAQAWGLPTPTIDATTVEFSSAAQSLLLNGGFERGTRNWTSSGGTFVTSSTSPIRGSLSGSWDSSAAAQTLTSSDFTIPSGFHGHSVKVSCLLRCASGTCTHTLEAFDGTNPIGSPVVVTSATTGAPATTATVTAPTSGTIAVRLTSVNANEPEIRIDDCLIARADRLVLAASTGQVITNASGTERIERAYITNGGSCAISSQSGTWITSVADPGTGLCDLTVTAWTTAPSCELTLSTPTADALASFAATITTTLIKTQVVRRDNGVATDENFHIICMGVN